jgi:hypothetical protein
MSWSEDFSSMLFLLVMATLLRASYELSRQRALRESSSVLNLPSTSASPKKSELMPWQREASAKAIKRYAEAQEKKWRRWNEAMFERV